MGVLKFFLLSFGIIILDQSVKMLVHLNMEMGLSGQILLIGDWFKLHYTLNPGMAFGIELGTVYGKLGLTVFRFFAMIALAWYIYHLNKNNAKRGFIWCMALILGGAVGNVIDSIFYGVILDNAPKSAPFPWFYGQVIDMFYFDIWEGFLPQWLPIVGGEYYSFWPIFNIADASIFVGVAILLIFQKSLLTDTQPAKVESEKSII